MSENTSTDKMVADAEESAVRNLIYVAEKGQFADRVAASTVLLAYATGKIEVTGPTWGAA